MPGAGTFGPSTFLDHVVWRMLQFGWPPDVCGDSSKTLLAGKLRAAKRQQNPLSYPFVKRKYEPSPFSMVHVEATLRLAAREAGEFAKSHRRTGAENLSAVTEYLQTAYPRRAQKALVGKLSISAKKESDDDAVDDGPPVVPANMIIYDVIAQHAERLVREGEFAAADESCTLALARLDEHPIPNGDYARARVMLAQARAKLAAGSASAAAHIAKNLADRYRDSNLPDLRKHAALADSLRREAADIEGDFIRAEMLAAQHEESWSGDAADSVKEVAATEMAARRTLLERRGQIDAAELLATEMREAFEESSQHGEQLALADALASWSAVLCEQSRFAQAIAICDLVYHLYVADESPAVREWVGKAMGVKMYALSRSGERFGAITVRYAIFRDFSTDPNVGVFRSIRGARQLLAAAKSSLARQAAKSVSSPSAVATNS